jgi:glycosyltransferase involved in cell wall biosynthesis
MPASWVVPDFQTLFHRGRTADWVVVIPVINEGARILSLLEKMSGQGIPAQADILIVDGGTTDGSLDPSVLQSLGVRTLLLKTGPGKLGAQLRCAYAFALCEGYAGVLTIDGNDKDNPSAIPAFIQALKDGVDFVQASRFIPGGRAGNTPRSRDLAIRLVHAPLLSLASGFKWTDTTQGFRAYSARLLRDENVAPFRAVFGTYELLAYLSYCAPRLGYKCVELPTERTYPKTGGVPTKISSFRGNFEVLRILFAACLGKYDPPRQTPPPAGRNPASPF